MPHNPSSVRRARSQRPIATRGYIITWDVDSGNPAQCSRLKRFIFGQTLRRKGREDRYPGFIERQGVRYLGQSVLFLTLPLAALLNRPLRAFGVDHHTTATTLPTEPA